MDKKSENDLFATCGVFCLKNTKYAEQLLIITETANFTAAQPIKRPLLLLTILLLSPLACRFTASDSPPVPDSASAPAEGWEQFLENDSPRWNTIVVAGHSQGGGRAVYFAKLHPVERVIAFTWVDVRKRELASWITDMPSACTSC